MCTGTMKHETLMPSSVYCSYSAECDTGENTRHSALIEDGNFGGLNKARAVSGEHNFANLHVRMTQGGWRENPQQFTRSIFNKNLRCGW